MKKKIKLFGIYIDIMKPFDDEYWVGVLGHESYNTLHDINKP